MAAHTYLVHTQIGMQSRILRKEGFKHRLQLLGNHSKPYPDVENIEQVIEEVVKPSSYLNIVQIQLRGVEALVWIESKDTINRENDDFMKTRRKIDCKKQAKINYIYGKIGRSGVEKFRQLATLSSRDLPVKQ